MEVGTLTNPLPVRIYESLAWSFDASFQVLFGRSSAAASASASSSSAFREVTKGCDAKLEELGALPAATDVGRPLWPSPDALVQPQGQCARASISLS